MPRRYGDREVWPSGAQTSLVLPLITSAVSPSLPSCWSLTQRPWPYHLPSSFPSPSSLLTAWLLLLSRAKWSMEALVHTLLSLSHWISLRGFSKFGDWVDDGPAGCLLWLQPWPRSGSYGNGSRAKSGIAIMFPVGQGKAQRAKPVILL